MSAREWLAVRGVELLAACFVAAVLIGAWLSAFRARIPEVMLYGVACVAAVLLRSVLDLAAFGIVLLGHSVRALFHLRPWTQLGPAPSR